MDTYYNDMYSCLNAGHQESLDKMEEIGKEDINKHEIYIKFVCMEKEIIIPKRLKTNIKVVPYRYRLIHYKIVKAIYVKKINTCDK